MSKYGFYWPRVASGVWGLLLLSLTVAPRAGAATTTTAEVCRALIAHKMPAYSGPAEYIHRIERDEIRAIVRGSRSSLRVLLGRVTGLVKKVDPGAPYGPLEGISDSLIAAFRADGGSLFVTHPRLPLGGKFLVKGGRPFLFLRSGMSAEVVHHELEHFLDWREIREGLLHAGVDKDRAGDEAFYKMLSVTGTRRGETRATLRQVEVSRGGRAGIES